MVIIVVQEGVLPRSGYRRASGCCTRRCRASTSMKRPLRITPSQMPQVGDAVSHLESLKTSDAASASAQVGIP
jgi:hypothetical protein